MLQGIHTFLERFRLLEPPEGAIKKALVAAIKEEVGVVLSENAIRLQSGVAYVAGNPALRSEIVLHKSALLIRVRTLTTGNHKGIITDIR